MGSRYLNLDKSYQNSDTEAPRYPDNLDTENIVFTVNGF